jgi:hypothetical protein
MADPDGRPKLRCVDCEGEDPLKSVIAQRWADGPLKPPAK